MRRALRQVPVVWLLGMSASMVGCDIGPSESKRTGESVADGNTAVTARSNAESNRAGGAIGASKDAASAAGAASEAEHDHRPGAHGGVLVSLGRDSYHVEAVLDTQGQLRLYTLGNDETKVIDVPAQTMQGYIKAEGSLAADPIAFAAEPQPGDAGGRASCFVASLPENFQGVGLDITIPNVAIDGERFRLAFSIANAAPHGASAQHGPAADHGAAAMPAAIGDEEERSLYLTPGGRYTLADIAANGESLPSIRFRGIASAHDMKPKPGDRICPITATKANAEFAWVVDGKTYLFCCPPCVDEFVQLAKVSQEALPPPESFVKRDPQP
jgi:YHS domain-containing protein